LLELSRILDFVIPIIIEKQNRDKTVALPAELRWRIGNDVMLF